jgi:threonine dehydrogenase-like Zn-dependent dehydrogenase
MIGMKAVAVFPKTKRIDLIEQASKQELSPTGVRLRMLEVGICGTDKEIATFQYGTPPVGSDHLVIGHESLAEVDEVGSEVRNISEGDLVVSMVRRPCSHPECTPCRLGRQDFCITGDYFERGIKGLDGFMTGVVTDEEKYLHKVPHALRDVAVLVEPLTIAEKAFAQLNTVQSRLPGNLQHKGTGAARPHNALVLGAGPVGLLGCMALMARGYRTSVFTSEGSGSKKANIAKAIGVRYFSAENYGLPKVGEEIGNIDVIYEATGASGLAFDSLQYLGVNAVFIFTGVPGRKAPIKVDTSLIMRNLVLKNQILLGTVNAGADAYDAAIGSLGTFMQRWPEAVRSLITGRYPIEAFRDLLSGKITGIKNVIRLDSNGSD